MRGVISYKGVVPCGVELYKGAGAAWQGRAHTAWQGGANGGVKLTMTTARIR